MLMLMLVLKLVLVDAAVCVKLMLLLIDLRYDVGFNDDVGAQVELLVLMQD